MLSATSSPLIVHRLQEIFHVATLYLLVHPQHYWRGLCLGRTIICSYVRLGLGEYQRKCCSRARYTAAVKIIMFYLDCFFIVR